MSVSIVVLLKHSSKQRPSFYFDYDPINFTFTSVRVKGLQLLLLLRLLACVIPLMGSTSRNTTPMLLLLLVVVLSVEPLINVSVLPHKLLVVSG